MANQKYISGQNIKLPVHLERPQIPRCILYLLSNKKNAKGFYNILVEKPGDLYVHLNEKWKNELNCIIEEQSWSKIFTICFKVINNENLIWFQYRIIHKILGTEELLYKMSIKSNRKCLLCDNSPETLIHLFCLCPQVAILWKDIEKLIHFRTNIKVKLSVPEILFGYLNSDHFIPLNTIILGTKNYLFSASRKKPSLALLKFKPNLELLYNDQYFMAKVNSKEKDFENCWTSFNTLFCE